jgi:hypothetical protein
VGEPFAYEGCPGNEPLAHELEKDRVATGRLSFQIDDERCSAPEDIVTGVSEFCCDLVRFAVGREVTCLAIEREKPGAVGLVDERNEHFAGEVTADHHCIGLVRQCRVHELAEDAISAVQVGRVEQTGSCRRLRGAAEPAHHCPHSAGTSR